MAVFWFAGCLFAQPGEPVPLGVVSFQDQELPVYRAEDATITRIVDPVYPRSEQDRGISGEAMIEAVVDPDGKVVAASIKESRNSPAFGIAARKSVLKWRFRPMLKDGKPTRFMVRVPLVFEAG